MFHYHYSMIWWPVVTCGDSWWPVVTCGDSWWPVVTSECSCWSWLTMCVWRGSVWELQTRSVDRGQSLLTPAERHTDMKSISSCDDVTSSSDGFTSLQVPPCYPTGSKLWGPEQTEDQTWGQRTHSDTHTKSIQDTHCSSAGTHTHTHTHTPSRCHKHSPDNLM